MAGPAKIRTTFFRSKVAQRIVILFVSCALLPVTILTVVSFYEVSSQLREDNARQLMRASKNQAMAIYERIELLDSDLQLLTAQVSDRRTPAISKVLQDRFDSVTVFGPDGSARALWGSPATPPQLSPVEQEHLRSGEPLIQVVSCSNGNDPCVRVIRTTEQRFTVVGMPKDDYLWAAKNVPAGFEFVVLSSGRVVLMSSDDQVSSAVSQLPAFDHASGFRDWGEGDLQYNAAFWKLLIGPMYREQPWTVVISQPKSDALASLARFRRSFPLVMLLALWVVLFVSMVQVRRTLVPLERLQEGTDKIGSGRFESRVEVYSNDEFQELAASFNSMAAQLGRQFHTLKTINQIDEAIFASLNREAIVDGVLTRMPSLLRSACFGVALLDEAHSSGWIRFRDIASGNIHTETTSLAGRDLRQLQESPDSFTISGEQHVPDYLLPLKRIGMRSFRVLPIRVQDSIRAALICGQWSAEDFSPEDTQGARQVADQLAIALSHAGLIQALEELQLGSLTALARAIDAKSQWTGGHSERVTELAVRIGKQMGLTAKDLRTMQMGGLLHDIGKIGTPPAILDKPGRLTDDEMAIMREHVATGVRILEPVPGFQEALPIVAQHHEWFNGQGYPLGLAGAGISLHARIFAVADCYDALTSDRPYRKGLPAEQTITMLCEKSGIQFDPQVIEAFRTAMAEGLPEQSAAAASAGNA
jgi:putative nucleotidyltransferase with HDIG domain